MFGVYSAYYVIKFKLTLNDATASRLSGCAYRMMFFLSRNDIFVASTPYNMQWEIVALSELF